MARVQKNEKPKRYHGVHVVLDQVKKATSLDEFKKANPNIFDHLGENENAAYAELFKDVSAPVAKAEATKADAPKV